MNNVFLKKLILNEKKQIEKAVKSANTVITQITYSLTYFDPELIKSLYLLLFIEYAVLVRNHFLRKVIESFCKTKERTVKNTSYSTAGLVSLICSEFYFN